MPPLFWPAVLLIGYVATAGVAGLVMLRLLRRRAGADDLESPKYLVFDDGDEGWTDGAPEEPGRNGHPGTLPAGAVDGRPDGG